jgi:uncharacterized membrane protein YbhN (UPF0104 family)
MRLSKRGVWVLRALLSTILVSALVWKVGPQRLAATLGQADPGYLIMVLLLAAPRLLVKTARWKLLASRAVKDVSWIMALKSLLVGTAAAVVTPGRVGQASSALYFPKGHRIALSGMALLDPASDLFVVIVLAAFVLLGIMPAIGIGLVLAVVSLATTSIGERLSSRNGRVGALGTALKRLTPTTVVGVALLAAVIYGFNLLQFHLLLRAHAPVPFLVSAKSLPLIFLAVACPITIAGFGIREAAAALVLAQHGIGNPVAVQTSFLLFVINLLLPGLAGAILAGRIGEMSASREIT